MRTLLSRLIRYLWPPKQCRTCDHSDNGGTLCFEALGHGYGHEVDPEGWCDKWKKRQS